jgi:hypothetical protein
MLDHPNLNPTHRPRIQGSQLRAGSYYYLATSTGGAEMKFAEPLPHSTRVDVIADGDQLVEETRVVRVSNLATCRTCRTCHQPPGRAWKVFDASHPSFIIFRRKPPWLRGHYMQAALAGLTGSKRASAIAVRYGSHELRSGL